MTVLSGQTIRRLGIFSPFSERSRHRGMSYGLSHCGYDVRIDLHGVQAQRRTTLTEGNVPGIILAPGDCVLAATMEHFSVPVQAVGIVHDKSTWARRGLAVQNTVAEPGWKGYLTLELTNHGNSDLSIFDGDPIAQVIFHLIDEVPETTYSGKYQAQKRGPQNAIFEDNDRPGA